MSWRFCFCVFIASYPSLAYVEPTGSESSIIGKTKVAAKNNRRDAIPREAFRGTLDLQCAKCSRNDSSESTEVQAKV